MCVILPGVWLGIMNSFKVLAPTGVLVMLALSGCIGIHGHGEDHTQIRDIRMWIQAMDWDLHPNVEVPVWAFCAEGNGVQPIHGEDACGVPAPTIRVNRGDTIRLTFQNTHSIPHTVHFHGWHGFEADMNGASLLGDEMLVQPGGEVTITWVAEPAGSFIYHCHFQTPTHMDMGMYGVFIVEDPDRPSKADQDYIAVLDEWAIHDEPKFVGNLPEYNFFTINGKSFPQTQPWIAERGDLVRLHVVNAGFEFHAVHLHGYTPNSWEGVAGPQHAVPTDVREIAPGQTIVLEFEADREGVWLFHDHVVPRVTAASDGSDYGVYPRGMLTVLVVGDAYLEALGNIAPDLLAAAARDAVDSEPAGHDAEPQDPAPPNENTGAETVTLAMKGYAYEQQTLEVTAGTTVQWVNQDPAAHTVTFTDGSVDSGNIGSGQSWSHTFTAPGTYKYYCKPHAYQDDAGDWQGMVATVVVT